MKENLIVQFSDSHRLISSRTCSRDDRTFLLTATQIGFNSAVAAAEGFGWECYAIMDALRRFLIKNSVPESDLRPVDDRAMKANRKKRAKTSPASRASSEND